jgi:hypothetical protein
MHGRQGILSKNTVKSNRGPLDEKYTRWTTCFRSHRGGASGDVCASRNMVGRRVRRPGSQNEWRDSLDLYLPFGFRRLAGCRRSTLLASNGCACCGYRFASRLSERSGDGTTGSWRNRPPGLGGCGICSGGVRRCVCGAAAPSLDEDRRARRWQLDRRIWFVDAGLGLTPRVNLAKRGTNRCLAPARRACLFVLA